MRGHGRCEPKVRAMRTDVANLREQLRHRVCDRARRALVYHREQLLDDLLHRHVSLATF